MSMSEAVVGILFKRDDRGRTLFFPNGVMGGGYVVPDAAVEARLRSRMTWLQFGAIFSGIGGVLVAQMVLGPIPAWPWQVWAGFAAAIVALSVATRLFVMRLVKDLKRASDAARLTLGEVYARQVLALPVWYHWMQLVFSGLLAVTSLVLLIFNEEMTGTALVGVALFGAIAVYAVYGLQARHRQAVIDAAFDKPAGKP